MNPISIYANTLENIQAFGKLINGPCEDKPTVEMSDDTARDINVIWDSIKSSAKHWKGNKDACILEMPTNRKEFWGAIANHQMELLPVIKEFIDNCAIHKDKTAIDLGCGNSCATPNLLSKGWRVIAIDFSASVLKILASQYKEAIASGQLKIIEADISTYVHPEPVDLVIAADLFPFLDPSKIREIWSKIHENFVKKDGFLIGSFFRTSTTQDVSALNFTREMGAWFLRDRRMVRPLLTHTGYEIRTCKFRIDDPKKEPVCIQFIAKKTGVKKEEKEF